jgi:hypothetical protein
MEFCIVVMNVNVFVLPFLKPSIFQKETGGRKQRARQSSPDQTRQQQRKGKGKYEEEEKMQARICKL